jgi:uncharacterized protein YciI
MKGFLFRLIPPRTDFAFTMTEGEGAMMRRHLDYWSNLAAQGTAVAFGPVGDPEGPFGIGIVLVPDIAAAELLRDGDPAMTSPFGFRTEITPMLSLVTLGGRFDAM